MAINTLLLNTPKIGEVFTPLGWVKWLLLQSSVFEKWCAGASICDPTAGRGIFALGLFSIARERGAAISDEMLSRLRLIELRKHNLDYFLVAAKSEYGINFPKSSIYINDTITDTPNFTSDILVGNPPWANFTDLPLEYKRVLKPYFIAAGLVPDRKAVLLGSSRTDIAALILKYALGKLLSYEGTAHFFVPLSLFTGDDAHIGFRDYRCFSSYFSVSDVHEFNESVVFDGVGTSYCSATFTRDKRQTFPIPYFRENSGTWLQKSAIPLRLSTDPWRVIEDGGAIPTHAAIDVKLRPEQKPRQGVNTCGANDVFIFEDPPEDIDAQFIYPLATKDAWNGSNRTTHKWIFLPYNAITGRPLSEIEAISIRGYEYLMSNKERLVNRKGTLISSAVKKGLWWSLLGVGPYSFAPFKVIWQAYGKSNFTPIILSSINGKPWQGNQAMHAFIPCWTRSDAERIALALKNPHIETLLSELNGSGKCNWAQPGKIKKILAFDELLNEQMALFEPPAKYRM